MIVQALPQSAGVPIGVVQKRCHAMEPLCDRNRLFAFPRPSAPHGAQRRRALRQISFDLGAKGDTVMPREEKDECVDLLWESRFHRVPHALDVLGAEQSGAASVQALALQ